ncbi:MAG: glycoside hydrolase family 2 protein [Coraliomargaritaceae bacterium]
MAIYQQYEKRTVVSLGGIWEFNRLSSEQKQEAVDPASLTFPDIINVPGCYDMMPDHLGARSGAFYKRTIKVPAQSKARLHFGGLSIWGRVFVDGELIAEHRKPYSSFWCDIPLSEKAERELIVYVDNRFDQEACPLVQPEHDYHLYGGIFREVSLHYLPDCFIENVKIDTVDYQTGRVGITVFLGGTLPKQAEIGYAFDDNKEEQYSALLEANHITFQADVPNFECWSPKSPHLHTLRLTYGPDDRQVRFGIRTVETKGNALQLNGEPLKLLGFNRHEAHPTFGAAVPIQQQIADLQLIKDLGCNFIRGSHYPQDDSFLDLCDQLGILVWEESVGWGQTTEHFRDPYYRELNLEQTREMIEAHWNHPSIIIWSFQNESESHLEEADLLYPDLMDLCKKLDSTRLVAAATNKDFQDRFLDQVDVICFNLYPGWYPPEEDHRADRSDFIVPHIREMVAKLKAKGLDDRPFLISEIGAGAIYGHRDPLGGMWTEEYQSKYLAEVCNEVIENEAISGVGLWQFCDCRTYNGFFALRRPRSYNNKGILDEYRRPKLAYKVVKRIFNTATVI